MYLYWYVCWLLWASVEVGKVLIDSHSLELEPLVLKSLEWEIVRPCGFFCLHGYMLTTTTMLIVLRPHQYHAMLPHSTVCHVPFSLSCLHLFQLSAVGMQWLTVMSLIKTMMFPLLMSTTGKCACVAMPFLHYPMQAHKAALKPTCEFRHPLVENQLFLQWP